VDWLISSEGLLECASVGNVREVALPKWSRTAYTACTILSATFGEAC
jgi:hypothetical protein